MEMTPDQTVLFMLGKIAINATIFNTWIIMALLTGASVLVTRNLRPDVPPNRWRTALEVIEIGRASCRERV